MSKIKSSKSIKTSAEILKTKEETKEETNITSSSPKKDNAILFSVKVDFNSLYSYILNTYYRCMTGYIGIGISTAAIMLLVFGWGNMSVKNRIVYLIVASAFYILNPFILFIKTLRQYKFNKTYREFFNYSINNESITISQGDNTQEIEWSKITKLMMTGKMIAVYTSNYHAFIIPLKEIKDKKPAILIRIVQFSDKKYLKITKNLKEYKSGKGL